MTYAPVLTVISNFAYFLTAICAALTRLYYEAATFILIGIFSSIYHDCFDLKAQQCIVSPGYLQFMDFFRSYASMAAICVFFLDIRPRKFKAVAYLLFDIAFISIAYLDRFSLVYPIIVFSFVLVLAILHSIREIIVYMGKQRQWKFNFFNLHIDFAKFKSKFKPVDMISVTLGCVFFSAGFVCQIYSSTDYDILHSAWHIMTAIAPIFLFNLHRKENYMVMLLAKIKTCITSRLKSTAVEIASVTSEIANATNKITSVTKEIANTTSNDEPINNNIELIKDDAV